jgi:hypothetical protein
MTERRICTGINNREDEWVSTETGQALVCLDRLDIPHKRVDPVPDDNFAHALSVPGGFRLKLEPVTPDWHVAGAVNLHGSTPVNHIAYALLRKNAAILLFQQREVGCVYRQVFGNSSIALASHAVAGGTIGQEIRMPQFKAYSGRLGAIGNRRCGGSTWGAA